DAPAQRVALESQPVVLANLHVHADHSALADEIEDRRVQDQRPAMRNPAFDDDVGPDLPDELLHHHDVLWRLDDRNPQPGRLVADLLLPAGTCEEVGEGRESLWRIDVELTRALR